MPPAYSSAQKSAISDFASVTQVDKTTAARVLKQYNWNASAAVNSYFNSPASGAHLRTSLNRTFEKYRDNPKDYPEEINIEGSQQLLADLDIDISDVGALVFFDIVQSPSLGKITRDGFVDGWAEAGVDTLPKMRNIVLQRRSVLSTDREVLKHVYNHTFTLALSEEKQKALPFGMAEEFWRVLLSAPALEWRTASTPWLDWWIEFYGEKVKKAVNRDLWKQTLNFALQTLQDDTLSFWSEESSWPSVIDEFVQWVKEEKRSRGGGGGGGSGDAMEIS